MKAAPRGDLWDRGLRATRLIEQGEPAKAVASLAPCIRAGASWALLLRARAKWALGREDLASADVTRAFDQDPECGWIFGLPLTGNRARSHSGFRRLLGANKRFKKDRGSYPVRAFVGKLKIMRGRGREGLRDLDWAVRARPRQAYLFAWRAEARRRLDQTAGARRDVEKALLLDPRCALALTTRAALKRRRGEPQSALADASAASRLLRHYEMAPLEAARACLDLGDGDGVLLWLERAVLRSARLGWRALYDGALPRADIRADFERLFPALRLPSPRSAQALSWLGEALLGQGRREDARDVLGAALRLNPKLAWTWAWRGESLMEENRARAHAALSQSIEMNPRYPRALLCRGRLRLALGRPQKACADFDAALRLDGTWALAFFHRAQARAGLGQNAKALQDLDAALRLDQDFAQASSLRRRLRA